MRGTRRGPGLGVFLGILLATGPARAHNLAFTEVRVVLSRDAFRVDVACDLDALALGAPSSTDSAALEAEISAMTPAERDELARKLADFLARRLRLRIDGVPAPFEVSFPDRGKGSSPGVPLTAFGLVARLEGRLPAGAREATFFASRVFPLVRLTWQRGESKPTAEEVLVPGAESHPFELSGAAPDERAGETAWRFVALGFTHILPKGLDHILFVVGLALLSPRPKPLLAQVTSFTVAHTVTLGLSTYGVFALPPRVVEPLIALSIVYVALENLLTTKLRPARLVLVFAFGLLHGLGFAGVLSALGWPEGQRLVALLAFNAGVELGQITVIALALLIIAGWTRFGGERRTLLRWSSAAIAAVGSFWAVTRALGRG